MSSASAPTVDRIRIIPRPDDFLDRNIGSSGEVFFNKLTNSLRVYSGKDLSGFELARADLANISNTAFAQKVIDSGVTTGGGNASITVDVNPPSEPEEGQLWLDTNSGILYVYYTDANSSQWIQPVTSSGSSGNVTPSFTTIKVSGQGDIVADAIDEELTFVAGSNINITTDPTTNLITISATVTGQGITPNSFTTINVTGQNAITADSDTDTLNIVAGSGISITSNSVTDTITITNTQAAFANNFSGLNDAIDSGLTIDKIYLQAIARLKVDNSGILAYTFNSHYSGNNPQIFVISGTTIAFDLSSALGHPFEIQDATGTAYNTGLIHVSTNGTIRTGADAQGQDSGTLYWQVPVTLSGTYRYQCQVHANMVGTITVKNMNAL